MLKLLIFIKMFSLGRDGEYTSGGYSCLRARYSLIHATKVRTISENSKFFSNFFQSLKII